jgi:hypothetical protein
VVDRRRLGLLLVGGAALGAGAALLGAYRKPRAVLCVWKGSLMEAGWAPVAARAGFEPMIKVCDGLNVWRHENAGAFDEAHAAGLRPMGWGYHYGETVADAEAEAEAAAEACALWGVHTYAVNAEKQWFGAWGSPPVADPAAAQLAFAARFRELAPGVKLWWNGFGWERYKDSSGTYRDGVTAQSMRAFDAFAPMLYRAGTDTAKLRAKIAESWAKMREKATRWGLPFCPMVGSGRISSETGHVQGLYLDAPDGPGLVSLVAANQPDAWCVWYGSGSTGMLTEGNYASPALYRVPPVMRAARRAGASWAGTEAAGLTPGEGGLV